MRLAVDHNPQDLERTGIQVKGSGQGLSAASVTQEGLILFG